MKIKVVNKLRSVCCPLCGKTLIDLQNEGIKPEFQTPHYHNFWCDDCRIDITIQEEDVGY